MDPQQVAEIRACEGLYRPGEVAKHYGVGTKTVARIWANEVYRDIRPTREAPNVWQKAQPEDVRQDIEILWQRGCEAEEIATTLGISTASVYRYRGILV